MTKGRNLPLKIGIDARVLTKPITGVGRYVSNLVKHLIQLDGGKEEYLLILNDDISSLDFISNQRRLIFKKVMIPRFLNQRSFNNISSVLWTNFILRKVSLFNHVDILHSPNSIFPLFGGDFKQVLTINDMLPFVFPELHPRGYSFYIKCLLSLIKYRKIDRIIVYSEAVKKDISRLLNISLSKIEVVPLAPDEKFRVISDSYELARVKDKYNLPDKYFLFVGILERRKNVERMIKAFYKIPLTTRKSLKFILVGRPGWGYKNIENLIRQLHLENDVIKLRYIDDNDLPVIYNLACGLVFATLYEGFGLPVLEAMACGIPVIASNISSLPEIAGNAALVVSPFAVESIYEAMISILEDRQLCSALKQKGLEHACCFSWKDTAKKTLKVYREVASR